MLREGFGSIQEAVDVHAAITTAIHEHHPLDRPLSTLLQVPTPCTSDSHSSLLQHLVLERQGHEVRPTETTQKPHLGVD